MEAWSNFSKSFQYFFSTLFFSWFFVKNVVLMRTQEDNKVVHIKFGKFLSCLMTHITILFGKLNINIVMKAKKWVVLIKIMNIVNMFVHCHFKIMEIEKKTYAK
jgi:hypothetical protein